MGEFAYQGINRQGKRVEGKLEAPNEGELRMILRGQGVRPTRISRVGMLNQDLGSILRGGSAGKIGLEPLAVFTRQLQTLIGAGIPLVQALEVLVDQTVDRELKKVFSAVKEKVTAGSFLWESLAGYGKSFPRVYIALMRAAETSGAMESVLGRLAAYLEGVNKLTKMVKSAMMYPVIVIVVGVAVVGGMLVFVVPQFEQLLSSQGQNMPEITQMLIDFSTWIRQRFAYVSFFTAVGVWLIWKYFQSQEGRGMLQRVFFHFPILGPIFQKAGVARFTRTMGSLLGSGVNLVDSIDICKSTIDNVVLEAAMAKVRKDIESGKALAATLNQIPAFPKMAVQMIHVGEQTGSMEKMLDKISEIYENDVEQMVGGLSKLIEPIILVVLGGVVGFIMIALYLPVFQMAG